MHLLTGKIKAVFDDPGENDGIPFQRVNFITTHKLGHEVVTPESIWFHISRDEPVKAGNTIVVEAYIEQTVCNHCGSRNLEWIAGKYNCEDCGKNVEDDLRQPD